MTDKFEDFAVMCRRHDLTYEYSDDHSVWRKGSQSWDAIRRTYNAMNEYDKSVAKEIWNEVVKTKLKPDYADQWLWK
jgi:hypothetical protein